MTLFELSFELSQLIFDAQIGDYLPATAFYLLQTAHMGILFK